MSRNVFLMTKLSSKVFYNLQNYGTDSHVVLYSIIQKHIVIIYSFKTTCGFLFSPDPLSTCFNIYFSPILICDVN